MKMISSTNATSIRFVRLISALTGSASRRERLWITLQLPFPRQAADELTGKAFELAAEAVQPCREVVVCNRRRYRGNEADRSRDQRFCNTGRDLLDTRVAGIRDAEE